MKQPKPKQPKIPKPKKTWSDDELVQWAAAHPIGTRVRFWSVRGDDAYRDEEIRSEPWRLGHGVPIVKITGIAGGVLLDHLQRLEPACSTSEAQSG